MVNLPEGTTQNLMDYSSGTELFKYQWDFIHNPEGGWFVFEDSEEAQAVTYGYVEKIIDNTAYVTLNNITSHTFFTPAGYPITFNPSDNLFITSLDFISQTDADISVPEGALYKFKLNNQRYLAHYKKTYGTNYWEFLGYKKEGTHEYYTESQAKTIDLPIPFNANIFQNNELISIQSDYCIACDELCTSNKENYKGNGAIVSEIITQPLNYESYLNAFSSSHVLTQAIEDNPCVLLGMQSFGMIPPQSEWMEELNNCVAIGMAVAFAPAVLEILIVPVTQGVVDAGAAFWGKAAVQNLTRSAISMAKKKIAENVTKEVLRKRGEAALYEFFSEIIFQVSFDLVFEDEINLNWTNIATNSVRALTENKAVKYSIDGINGFIFESDGSIKSMEKLKGELSNNVLDAFGNVFIAMLTDKIIADNSIKTKVYNFIDGNNSWKLFEKLGKWGAPEAIQWAFVRNTVGFGQAVSYMSEAYTKNAFSKFTEVLLSVNSDSPVIVIGGNDYENVVVQKDHINTNVLPNHEIVVHQFTESELSEMESFITEWENNYSDSNFNQEDFMIRFKATGAISRYCAFLNANKDNTFVDVSRFHGVEFSSITSIPDPLYYIEREIVFKQKTKYENWGR